MAGVHPAFFMAVEGVGVWDGGGEGLTLRLCIICLILKIHIIEIVT
jgi:hypothetical protein